MRSIRLAVVYAVTTLVVALGVAVPSSAGAADSTTAADRTAVAPAALPAPLPASDSSDVSIQAMGDCTTAAFCFWVNLNYGNGPGRLSGTNPDWRVFAHSSCQTGNWSDCASSGWNRVSQGMAVYQHINYGGYGACLPSGWYHSNFANLVWPGTSTSFNDSISSNALTTAC